MADNPYLSSLVEAWGGDESAIPDIETDPFPDETLSPGMSEFIRVARRYVAGVVDDHGFVDSIQEIADRLAVYLSLHRQLVYSLPLTFPQQALGHLATQALITFSDGLADMVACFSQGDLPRVDQGIDRCKQAIIILEAWWIELCRVVRHETSRVCSECGLVNPPGESHCSNCQAPFTMVADEFQPDHEFIAVADSWVTLYKNTQKMLAGSLPSLEWATQIENLRAEVVEIQRRLRDIPAWEEGEQWLAPDLVDSYDDVFAGLHQLRLALEQMQRYPQEKRVESLNQAWFKLMSALSELGQPCGDMRYELLTLLDDMEADSELA